MFACLLNRITCHCRVGGPGSIIQLVFGVVGLVIALFLTLSIIVISPKAVAVNDSLGACGDYQDKNFYSISDIQGRAFTSPLLGKWVVTEGIVTVVLQGPDQYRGFWLQQTGAHNRASALPLTTSALETISQGIFVYHDSQAVVSGQRLRLLAQVVEYKGLTKVQKLRSLMVCEQGVELPRAVSITLPVTSLAQLEAKEGMRIILPQVLVISDLHGAGYSLGNHGQFAVSSKLHAQPTERWTAAQIRRGEARLWHDQTLDYLLIDDGSAKAFPKFIPYPKLTGFSADTPIRVSDRVSQVEGILHAYDDHYVIIPDPKIAVSIRTDYPRTDTPLVSEDSNIVIASMNLGNYFNGDVANKKLKDHGFPAARGAKSKAGFILQTEKIISAMVAMNADIIAVMEVENDGYGTDSAIHSLTQALNKKLKAKHPSHTRLHYQYVEPDNSILKNGKLGYGAISVGLLYRPQTVSLHGAVKILDARSTQKTVFDDRRHRPSLIQQFRIHGQDILIAVNHFKAKGRPCDDVEVDALQGHCNISRYRAALALVEFLKQSENSSLPTLILGDLNAYSQEEPLLALYNAGFVNLKYEANFLMKALRTEKEWPSFSYSFKGRLGNLDHALASAAFLPFIKSVDSWHINSLEDILLDYHTEENGHQHPAVDTYGSPDMYRSSDHDPVVLGLQFPDVNP